MPDDRYPPIADHAVVGDGETAALVGLDARIGWACLPRFDSPAVLASLLDADRGGRWDLPVEGVTGTSQRYVEDTAVVVTQLRTADGVLEVTDVLAVAGEFEEKRSAARQTLLRRLRVVEGRVRVASDLRGFDGAAVDGARVPLPGGEGGRTLRLRSSRPGAEAHELVAGDTWTLALTWAEEPEVWTPAEVDAAIEETIRVWRSWAEHVTYSGPYVDAVRRSAITLKVCDHHVSGAVVAAVTSSLPEAIGGERNWDYRFTWVRDAAYTVYAMRRVGMVEESDGFLDWVLDACTHDDGRPDVLYTLDGHIPGEEQDDDRYEGYRGSRPVRWGNGAAGQLQHDVYGEILDCAWQFVRAGGQVDDRRFDRLRHLATLARENAETPDQGIWEIRDAGRPFTYSVAMCQVALDRFARIARATGREESALEWEEAAEALRAELLERAWSAEDGCFTEHLDQPGTLDASLLALPLRRVVDAADPRMVATTAAVVDKLRAGEDLLYRYLHTDSPDGLEGEEGAFLLCSFWWVDNLVQSGRVEQARDLFEKLLRRQNHVGLLSEEIDPENGEFLGNFPQAFSHIGLISSAVLLDRAAG
ncbi:glycoside hydrolase family 15 protein [Kineococcus gynurae]|uniref:Glycoside hydrolase family 15 protein n=1 Tax=Kineococcus gynurae TaxID=452979 RepID=A0ABV5LVV5_9ACTN